MTFAELMHQLRTKHPSAGLNQVCDEAIQAFAARRDAIIDAAHLNELNDQYHLYKDKQIWEDVLRAADLIRQRPELLKMIYLLKAVFQKKEWAGAQELAGVLIAHIARPENHEAPLAGDFAGLFALLALVPQMVARMRARNLPRDIVQGTLDEFAEKVRDFQMRQGRPGVSSYVSWLRRFVDLEIIRVGRFNMEMKKAFSGQVTVYRNGPGCQMLVNGAVMHRSGMMLGAAGCRDETGAYRADIRETADACVGYPVGRNGMAVRQQTSLGKDQWQQVLTTGDPVLSVHIPAQMSLAREICEASYARTRKIFAEHFPDFAYKAFYCESWLIDPQLAGLLGKESNITRFQEKYRPYPNRDQGTAVTDFVFLKPRDAAVETWPEDTRLRKAIKKHYLAGQYIYALGGVFF